MPTFKRFSYGPPDPQDGHERDVRVDNLGYVWKKRRGWRIIRRLTTKGIIDVTGPPTFNLGQREQVALTATGHCWRKSDQWDYEGCLVKEEPQDVLARDLTVRGNFVPPVVNGKIPVYNQMGQWIGNLNVEPKE